MYMKYTAVKNPQWADQAHTMINCEVDFDNLNEEFVVFTAVASGDYEHTHEIFARCVAGEFGDIAEYQPPAPPADIVGDEAVVILRERRDYFLKNVLDPIVSNPLRWAELTTEQQQAWAQFRRDLLDLPANYPTPSLVFNVATDRHEWVGVVWPVQPE